MGTSVSRAILARIRATVGVVAAATLALALSLASTAFADEGTEGSYSGKEAGQGAALVPSVALAAPPSSYVSADVLLSEEGEGSNGVAPVVGSFTVDGLTYAVGSGEAVALVAVDAASPLVEWDDGDAFLRVPASVSFGGLAYSVTAVDRYAFYLSGVAEVELPSSVISVDERAFRSSDVSWAEVDPANPDLASFDGALYSADLSSLLLIPEGRAGAVLLPSEAEVADPSKFSHCSLVEAIFVEEGGAAFASWDGLLYDASGSTLLRVPAGATSIVIRDGCATVAVGSMEGCVKLESIEAPASVTEVHEPFLYSSGEASLQTGGVVALSLSDQPDVDDRQGADSVAEALASAVSVALPTDAEGDPWRQAGFWIESSQQDNQPAMLSEDVSLSAGVDEPIAPIASTQSAATANATTRDIPYRVFGPDRLYVSIEPSGSKYPYVYQESYFSQDYEDYSNTLFNGRTGYSQAFTFSSSDSNIWTTTYLSKTHFPDDVAFQKTTPTINGVAASAQKSYLHLYIQSRSDANQAHCWIGTSGAKRNGALFPSGVERVRVVEKGAGGEWTPDNLTITDRTSATSISLKSNTATVRIFLNGCMQSKVTWKKLASDSSAYSTTLVDPYGTPNVPTAPTRTGYTFAGWEDASGNLVASATATKTNTSVFGDVTYIARWTKNPVYTITLNKNGGSGGTSTLYLWYGKGWYTTSNPTDSSAAVTSITAPTWTGRTFKGYSTSPTATSGSYWTSTSSMPSNTAFSSHTTLYAAWQKNPVYTITLNKNGGSGGTSTLYLWYGKGWYTTSNPTDSSVAVTSITAPTWTGRTFKGYSTSSTATYGSYWTSTTSMPSNTAFSSHTTLYAAWLKNPVYAITLNSNGGPGGAVTIYEWYGKGWYSTSNPTDSTAALDRIYVQGWDGRTFKGYSTSSTATYGSYWTSTTSMPSNTAFSSHTNLYAVWQKNAISTVNLYMNAGNTTTLFKTIYLWYGKGWYSTSSPTDSSTALTTIGTPSWPGRTYKGFATSSTATAASYWTSVTSFPSSTDSTFGAAATAKTTSLYAVWRGNEVTLTWDPHNGQPVSTTKQTHSTTSTARVGLPTAPEWEGRVFAGWYTAASGGTQVTNATALPVSDTTYHAHWTENAYTISYDYDGGSVSGNPTTYTVTSATFSLKSPTRTGYVFTGWSGTGLSGDANMTVQVVKGSTGNRSYAAHWRANGYAVEYYDSTGATLLSRDEKFVYDESRALAGQPAGYPSPGYEALGWASSPGQSAPTYRFGQQAKNLATGASGDEVKRLYLAESPSRITLAWVSLGVEHATTSAMFSLNATVPMPSSMPSNDPGWAFMGWWTEPDGGEQVTAATPLPTSDATYYAHWEPMVAVDVPLEVTAQVDLLGLADQVPASGWIESRSGGALEVAEVSFAPLAGAGELFGDRTAEVFLEALAAGADGVVDSSTAADVRFALSAAAAEVDGARLAAFALPNGYGTRVPIAYRFAIPDDVLASIDPGAFSEATTAVGQVVYTVRLAS